METLCKKCKTPIKIANWNKNRKYCSTACYSANKRGGDRITKNCKTCQKEFDVTNWDSDKKYCSQECYWVDKTSDENVCICGKKIKGNRKYCSKKCYGLSKTKQNSICIQCNKEYKSTLNTSKYCSRQCYWDYRNDNHDIKMQSNHLLGDIRLIGTCLNCEKEFKYHKYRKNTANFCSTKCHYNYHNTTKICPTCKKEFTLPTNEANKKTYCSETCICITRDSKFERDIKNYLSQFVEINENKSIRLSNRTIFPDIEFNNIIIECYGDYWHCNPIKYDASYYHSKLRKTAQEVWDYDKNKNNLLIDNGYIVYVIWETEYKKDLNVVKQKIKEIYETHKN